MKQKENASKSTTWRIGDANLAQKTSDYVYRLGEAQFERLQMMMMMMMREEEGRN